MIGRRQKALRFGNFVCRSAKKMSVGRNDSGCDARMVSAARDSAVWNIVLYVGRTHFSAALGGNQASVTAGIVMHPMHLLAICFWAIHLCATDKCGISAVQLSRTLDICYESSYGIVCTEFAPL